MRRVLLLGGVLALALAVASQASAGTTTVSVSMTFAESNVASMNNGCPAVRDLSCGNGAVNPFGHATETILFGGACGGFCDLRTVSVAGGSIVMDEFFSNPTCPGACQPNRASPISGTLTDVVVGGTGIFTGASGNLSGSVTAAGPASLIQLSGTITLTT